MKILKKLIDAAGNRIKNLRTDTPVHQDDVVPKHYVDINTTYDTAKANTHKNPFKFPWITNAYNKPVVEVLDDLLYPLVLPEYKNPTIDTDIEIILNENDNSQSPHLINSLSTRSIVVGYNITPNDRSLISAVQLIITYNDGTPVKTVNDTNIQNSGTITTTTTLFNITQITVRGQFGATSNNYLDSYGNIYVDPAFTTNLTLNNTTLLNNLINNPKYRFEQWLVKFNSSAIIDGNFSNIEPDDTNQDIRTTYTLTPSQQLSTTSVTADTYDYRAGKLLMVIPSNMVDVDLMLQTESNSNKFSLSELMRDGEYKILDADRLLISIPYTFQDNMVNLILS